MWLSVWGVEVEQQGMGEVGCTRQVHGIYQDKAGARTMFQVGTQIKMQEKKKKQELRQYQVNNREKCV